MPKLSPIVALDRILSNLTKQWHEHHDALAEIEVVFAKYGIDPAKAPPAVASEKPVASKPTATPAAPVAKKGKRRRRLGVSGPEFILGLLSGGRALTTAQASAEWVKANRPGKADQALSFLTRGNKIKREAIKDGRGSKYMAI